MGLAQAEMLDRFGQAGLSVFERGWLSSNNILFVDGERNVLVDSGYASHASQTVALVRQALGGAALQRVLNTHLHSDHCGGNHALQAAFVCSVDIPAGEAAKVDAWDEIRLSYRDTGQRCPRFNRDGVVRDGDTVRLGRLEWEVIAAPGHDPESVVIYQPALKLLISADALWENGFGVVFPEIEGVGAFDDVASTLDRIAALEVDAVIPGHGSPFGDVSAAIARARTKLSGFVSAPARHARHAAKVLVKFHLLEHQRESWPSLRNWMASTRYMRLLHETYFGRVPFADWAGQLVEDLCTSGALRSADGVVFNA